jgi:hypothetical protein
MDCGISTSSSAPSAKSAVQRLSLPTCRRSPRFRPYSFDSCDSWLEMVLVAAERSGAALWPSVRFHDFSGLCNKVHCRATHWVAGEARAKSFRVFCGNSSSPRRKMATKNTRRHRKRKTSQPTHFVRIRVIGASPQFLHVHRSPNLGPLGRKACHAPPQGTPRGCDLPNPPSFL